MTTATPIRTPPCRHCGNAVRRTERDEAGFTITCTICGGCEYLDKNGRQIGETEIQELREIRNRNIHPLFREDPEPDPQDAYSKEPGQPEREEIRDEKFQPWNPRVLEPADEEPTTPRPTGELNGEPGPTKTQTQSQEKEQMTTNKCPFCQVLHRQSPEQADALLTHCDSCEKWFITNPKLDYDKNDEAAVILYLYHQGMKASEIFEATAEITSLPQRNSTTGLTLIRKHTMEAIRESEEYKPLCSSEWLVFRSAFQNLSPLYYAWTITDSATQYVLATQVSEDPELDPDLVKTAIETGSRKPDNVVINKQLKTLEARIAHEFRSEVREEQNLSLVDGAAQMIRIHNAIKGRHQQFTRNRKNVEALNMNMAGIAVDHNFFEKQPQLRNQTPAEAAGLAPRYSSWMDVVRRKPGDPQNPPEEETQRPAEEGRVTENPPAENGAPEVHENEAHENEVHEKRDADAGQEPASGPAPGTEPEQALDPVFDPTLNPNSDEEPAGPSDPEPERAADIQQAAEAPAPSENGREDPEATAETEKTGEETTNMPTLKEEEGDPQAQEKPRQEARVQPDSKNHAVHELEKLFNRTLERENLARLEYLKAEKDRLSVAATLELIKQT